MKSIFFYFRRSALKREKTFLAERKIQNTKQLNTVVPFDRSKYSKHYEEKLNGNSIDFVVSLIVCIFLQNKRPP